MQQAAASGQQYGVPDVPQFVGGGGGRPPHGHMLGISHEPTSQQHHLQHQLLQQQKTDSLKEIPSPVTSRTPAPPPPPPPRSANSFEQLMPSGGGAFGDEEALPPDDGERGSVGNRWPRQETIALLKLRSEMDATFRDASLKGPLWEDVSRRLAELGYHRSAKKCKEKFENVHKYYKRTKDGRAGRQDGKSYRFFSQLEALHGNNNNGSNANHARTSNNNNIISQAMSTGPGPVRQLIHQPPAPAMLSHNASGGEFNRVSVAPSAAAAAPNPVQVIRHTADFSGGDLSFSSDSSEEEDDYDEQTDSRKRKRAGCSAGTSSTKKMMLFFEQLMKQVMERQEMMQQKFLETIEKREQDRMIREEAWKRQEMARLNREHEIMAQERALSASRDAAFISFLQKMTGQTHQIPSVAPLAQSTTTINPVPIETHHHHHQHRDTNNNTATNKNNNNSQDASAIVNAEQMELSFDPSSSRWPKTEVHALIRLRSGMEPKYQDTGPKGPLWEEISAGMARLGYNRSAKRCKEKWENINKYFKKVKESNKKRPEDAKTCPYFHQLDQLYRKRILGGSNSNANKEEQNNESGNNNGNEKIEGTDDILAIMPPPGPSSDNNKTHGANNNNNNGAAIPSTNGATFYSSPENGSGADHQRPLKKPEGLVMDVMDMDDEDDEEDMQTAAQQQSIVDDYDDKIEGDDSDNNNDQEHNITTSNSHDHDRQPAVNHLPFAQFVHESRASSTTASSFMAMVHRLAAASDPPEFKSSKA